MAPRKDKEIADALNTAMKCNLQGVGTAVLTDLICEYFCTSDDCNEDEFSVDSSGSETERHVDDSQVDIAFDDSFSVAASMVSFNNDDDDVEPQSSDLPMVSVDEVSVVMSDAVVKDFFNDVVCNDNIDEMDRIDNFSCGCHKNCLNDLLPELILSRRLNMKELTEGTNLCLFCFG